jgi:hypothetical protein
MILGFKPEFVQQILDGSKKFTIREGKRWKPGMSIQMATGRRTKEYKQFNEDRLDLQVCKSVQEIKIKYLREGAVYPVVFIGSRPYRYYADMEFLDNLAKMDGFRHFPHFCSFHNKNKCGQIIHWTDLKL